MRQISTLKSVLDKGMVDTYRSDRDWGKLVPYVEELERQGYSVEIAPWSDEGIPGGYSVYVDRDWGLKEEVAKLDRLIEGVPARRQEAYRRYLNELTTINRQDLEYRELRSNLLFEMNC